LAAPTFWLYRNEKIKKLLFFLFPLEWRKKGRKMRKENNNLVYLYDNGYGVRYIR
jgi:hypothetical protein